VHAPQLFGHAFLTLIMEHLPWRFHFAHLGLLSLHSKTPEVVEAMTGGDVAGLESHTPQLFGHAFFTLTLEHLPWRFHLAHLGLLSLHSKMPEVVEVMRGDVVEGLESHTPQLFGHVFFTLLLEHLPWRFHFAHLALLSLHSKMPEVVEPMGGVVVVGPALQLSGTSGCSLPPSVTHGRPSTPWGSLQGGCEQPPAPLPTAKHHTGPRTTPPSLETTSTRQ